MPRRGTGEGNPAFVGIQAAAPLFFRIVDGLRAQQPDMAEPTRPVPAGIAQVEICLATGELRIEVYEYWPSDLARLFRQAGLPRRTPPALPAECAFEGAGHDGSDPQITSPIIGAAYTLRPGHDADAREMYWFANNSFIGRSASRQVTVTAVP